MTTTEIKQQGEPVWVVFADPFIDGKFYGRWAYRDDSAPHGFRVPSEPMKKCPALFNTPQEVAAVWPAHYSEAMAYWGAQQYGKKPTLRYSIVEIDYTDPFACGDLENYWTTGPSYSDTRHVAYFQSLKDVADHFAELRQGPREFTYSTEHMGWVMKDPTDRQITLVCRVMILDDIILQDRKNMWRAFQSYLKTEFDQVDALRGKPRISFNEDWVDDSDPEA